jgi:hypothetical protein
MRALSMHIVVTAKEKGWDRLSNGELLHAAEQAEVDVLFTTDQRIRYQQNLKDRRIALVVLTGTTKWARVRLFLDRIVDAVNRAVPGSYTEVQIPFD